MKLSNEDIKKILKDCHDNKVLGQYDDDDSDSCEAYHPGQAPLFGGLYGWICPKCGAVMSPFESCCIKCSGGFDFTWTANPNTTGTEYTISSSSECNTNVNESRCRKSVHESNYLQNKDVEGKCPDYKQDAPDGGYYD